MIRVYFDHNIALFDAFLSVFHLLAFLLFVFSQEHKAFTVTSWRDEHHLDHVFIVKLLMVSNLPHESVLLVVFSLRIVMLNEVIYQVRGMHDLLFAITSLRRKLIRASIEIPRHQLHPIHCLIADDS